MQYLAMALIAFVALEHIYFLVLEMFFWTKPMGRKVFGLTEQFADESRALAANQGLYNGFLAAGLVWSMFHPDAHLAYQLQLFFLACIIVAGLFGAATVNRRILWVQGAPAVVALLFVLLSY